MMAWGGGMCVLGWQRQCGGRMMSAWGLVGWTFFFWVLLFGRTLEWDGMLEDAVGRVAELIR